MEPASKPVQRTERCPVPPVWRRLGALAFLFFLVKGLLWLIVPALAAIGLVDWF